MTQEPQEQERRAKPSRPVFLSIICILTFAGSGLMCFSFSFIGLFYPMVLELSDKLSGELAGIEIFQNTPRWVFLLGGLLYATSFLGGALLWQMKKLGFHIYTSSQIALLFLTALFLNPLGMPSGDLLFTSAFIFLYALHLRIMK